jgi:hypothetical protein
MLKTGDSPRYGEEFMVDLPIAVFLMPSYVQRKQSKQRVHETGSTR